MTTLEISAAPAGNGERANRIKFADGFSADKHFFDQEIGWILLRVLDLSRDPSYTAKQLVSRERWSLLSDGDRKLLGRCIAYAVCRGLLPLEFVRGRHEYPLRYRIRLDN
jgi:hypothetical protein